MENELHFTVDAKSEPVRIDKYLSTQTGLISRNRIQRLIEEGAVLLNGEPILRTKEKVQPGDRIRIRIPPPQSGAIEPEAIPLDILYEDSSFLIVNKQAGLCVHPTEHRKTGTLVNALLHHSKELSSIGGVMRPGIVHRLDQATSGILLVAKNDDAHSKLSLLFKTRQIEKIYWAIVLGPTPPEAGVIDQPIGRHPADRKRMTILADGRKSKTMYRILRTGLGGTLLEVYPKTGRTHQIRVHLRHIGLSIAGDRLYGLRKRQGRGAIERLFEGYPGIGLHAKILRFVHPITGEKIDLEAPLPPIFQSVVDQMICLNRSKNDS
ncbi:MAG: RluA family pseudouridine synthase [Candidatus Omnitrophica bacterium]|nr:RluA family pseudouridine synthase [Candidatus Omnitrophota bacterium]